MPVHTICIESTSDQNMVALHSTGTWARGPGRTLSFRSDATSAREARLEIDDRVVRFGRAGPGTGAMTVVLQVATTDERLTLYTEQTGRGILTVRSSADVRSSEHQGATVATATLVLILDRHIAAADEAERREGRP